MNMDRDVAGAMLGGRILFVDDEPALLQGVERALRPTRKFWQCEFVADPVAALDRVKHSPFDVVVSDMRMPGMNGAEFLARAKELSPDSVRVMLTGNADLQTAMEAVNCGHVFQFLLKPCEGGKLVQSLLAALCQHRVQMAERELLRIQLEHSDQLAVVGQIAAGINHDLNNILAAIMLQAQLALTYPNESASPNSALTMIEEAAQRATELTQELNGLSRREDNPAFQTIHIPALVDACLRLARPLSKEKVVFRVQLAPNLPHILGDPGKLNRALMNLLLNAKDATPNGGEVCISAREQILSQADVGNIEERRPGHFVCIAVQDAGCGMDEPSQRRALKVSFTTKPPGQGTGLGLLMVQRVIRQHNGWVELQSAVQQGATFSLYLPSITEDRRQKSEVRGQTQDPKPKAAL